MSLLIRGGQVLGGAPAALARADVLVEGDRIAAVGPRSPRPRTRAGIDATGRIVLPGLANRIHTRRATRPRPGRQLDARGPPDHTSANYGFRAPEDEYLSAAIGAIEMLKTGCTSAYDLYMALPAVTDETFEAVVRAYDDVGRARRPAPAVADVVFYQTVPGLLDLLPRTCAGPSRTCSRRRPRGCST